MGTGKEKEVMGKEEVGTYRYQGWKRGKYSGAGREKVNGFHSVEATTPLCSVEHTASDGLREG